MAGGECPGGSAENMFEEPHRSENAHGTVILQAHESAQRQSCGPRQGALSFAMCSHYVPANRVPAQDAAEMSAVVRPALIVQPSMPSTALLQKPSCNNPQSPRHVQQGQPAVPTWQVQQAEPILADCSPEISEVDCLEESGCLNSQRPADFFLDPVECIPYSELEFIEHLGSGEFGTVCRGRFRDKEVAIKQLFWDNTMKEEVVLKDLEKEVESFRHLRHKNLVTFIGACLEIPHPCLVTEYMPGGSLHHLLHVRQLQLPMLHCLNMCMQLADGVRYLHSQDPVIVHRDLKTQNVVLDLNLNIKLCDFGLTESMERTHITKKNNGGSPRYMAPELFDCKTKITEKVDLWSMGCIFIEIFGGTLPYDGINTLADLTRELLVHKRPPTVPRHIPESLRQIMSRCHDFDYRQRPTANQVFELLGECKKHLRQVGALPDGTSDKNVCRSSESGVRSRRSRTAGAGA